MTEDSFKEIIISTIPTLYRVAVCYLPDEEDRKDAVQETLRRSWEKKDTIQHEEYVKTWIIRILINVCHDIGRKQKKLITIPIERMNSRKIEESSDHSDLKLALMSLHERERIPIILYYLEGYNTHQVSQILRIPAGTVKTRLKRGRDQLRIMLHEGVFEEG